MKKLIISEVISVILVLGIFLLVFSLLNGWEKAGQERYGAVVIAAVAAAAVAAVAAVVAVVAVVAVAVAAVAAVAAVVAVVGGVGGVVIAAVAVAAVVAVVGDGEIMEKINASKKVIWSSLGAEALAIILFIVLITFC